MAGASPDVGVGVDQLSELPRKHVVGRVCITRSSRVNAPRALLKSFPEPIERMSMPTNNSELSAGDVNAAQTPSRSAGSRVIRTGPRSGADTGTSTYSALLAEVKAHGLLQRRTGFYWSLFIVLAEGSSARSASVIGEIEAHLARMQASSQLRPPKRLAMAAVQAYLDGEITIGPVAILLERSEDDARRMLKPSGPEAAMSVDNPETI